MFVVAGTVSAMAGIVLQRRFTPSTPTRAPAGAGARPPQQRRAPSGDPVRPAVHQARARHRPAGTPSVEARLDILLVLLLTVPVYVFNVVGGHFRCPGAPASPGLPG